jgi:alginate O-acetyltransferase complex protein AlgI
MTFNSINFGIFFPILFILYWSIAKKNLTIQNLILLAASYIFYASWDWRFLFLLIFISLVNYIIGLFIQQSNYSKRKKIWLILGIVLNISVLIYFKYFNFFIESFISLFYGLGISLLKPQLNIILPVGLSFYIFLSLSYLIDIYRNNLKANKNLIEVLLTLSFFPIILAGPIQRPINLLPQIQKLRVFNYNLASYGLKQILWGFFMKVTIADKCAIFVNDIFNNLSYFNGSTLLLGGIFYSIEIYADFAGYSLIAIGISKLLGFELIKNFDYPYFSRDIKEFWRRWHISLTTWFRDYVFLPMSYSLTRKIPNRKVLFIKKDIFIYSVVIAITWMFIGLWHGANYNFVIWGLLNGFILVLYQIFSKPRKRLFKKLKIRNNNLLVVIFERLFTLLMIIFLWIIFRVESTGQLMTYFSGIFSISLFEKPNYWNNGELINTFFIAIIFFSIEWKGRNQDYALAEIGVKWRTSVRWIFYYFIILLILFFSAPYQQFIYFKF